MSQDISTSYATSNIRGIVATFPSENWDDDFVFQLPTETKVSPLTSLNINHDATHLPAQPPQQLLSTPSISSANRLSFPESIAWDELTPSPKFATHDEAKSDANLGLTLDLGTQTPGGTLSSISTSNYLPIPAPFPSTSDVASRSQQSWQEPEDDGLYDRDFDPEPQRPPPPPSFPKPPSHPYRRSRQPSSSQPHLPLSQSFERHSHSRSASVIHLPSRPYSAGSPQPTVSSSFTLASPYSPSGSLALHSTFSQHSGRALLPQAKEPPRVRRRLRKKSRPQNIPISVSASAWKQQRESMGLAWASEREDDASLFEEEERDINWEPVASPRQLSPPPQPRLPSPSPPPVPTLPIEAFSRPTPVIPTPSTSKKLVKQSPPPRPPTTPSQSPLEKTKEKTPILSRLGSIKRWRSKTVSSPSQTEEGELEMSSPLRAPKTPEPGRSQSPPARGWLFRSGSASSSVSPEGGAGPSRFILGRRRGSTPAADIVEHAEEEGDGEGWEAALKRNSQRINNTTGTVAGFAKKGKKPIPMSSFTGPPPPTSPPLLPVGSSKRPVSFAAAQQGTPTPLAKRPTAASLGRSSVNPVVEGQKSLIKKLSNIGQRGNRHHRNISISSQSSMKSEDDIPEEQKEDLTATLPPPPVQVLSHSTSTLLPPIALSPPSPPQTTSYASNNSLLRSLDSSATITPKASPVERLFLHPSPHLAQASSLGRSSSQPVEVIGGGGSPSHMRRNSLGDLKIPTRISMAQSGLKSNLGMVRDFAANVEKLKTLLLAHRTLTAGIQTAIRKDSRLSSAVPANVHSSSYIAHAAARIEEQYALWWEYAELLIELGGGPPSEEQKEVPSPLPFLSEHTPKGRERAITLAGASSSGIKPLAYTSTPDVKRSKSPPKASPPDPSQWRASTGRHDLSQRQLALLKEMIGSPSIPPISYFPPPQIPTPAAEASTSAITLQSSSASSHAATRTDLSLSGSPTKPLPSSPPPEGKLRRASRAGIMGIRDILKALKKSSQESGNGSQSQSQSSASVTSSSADGHARPRTPPPPLPLVEDGEKTQQRRPKSSSDRTIIVQHPNSPYNNNLRKSPRRPSLASIFRIGQSGAHPHSMPPLPSKKKRGKADKKRSGKSSTTEVESEDEYSDWDRMDSASDLDLARALGVRDEATVKGRRQFIPDHQAPPLPQSSSQVSLYPPQASPSKSSRRAAPPPALLGYHHPPYPGYQTASVRSAPPIPLPDVRLALTPENIKPLLECAKEVGARLDECVAELRALGVGGEAVAI